MMEKFFQVFILFAVAIVGFLTIYFSQGQVPENSQDLPKDNNEAKKVEILPERRQEKNEFFSQFPTFSIDTGSKEVLHIGIIGESQGDREKSEAFDEVVLKQLFDLFKKNKTHAVFFTGNLISNLSKEPSNNSQITDDPEQFQQELESFFKIFKATFGTHTPIFPIMGDQEMATVDYVKIFEEQFHLENSARFSERAIGYTVAIGPAFFAVVSTNDYNEKNKEIEKKFSPMMQAWLQDVLQQAAQKYKYRFVIGHEPVFSQNFTKGDQIREQNAFWKIMTDNHVLAYFASQEHFFDRTNRHGVWQIISGGGGAHVGEWGEEQPFFHCLLLTIPAEIDGTPKIEVFDTKGELVDSFNLSSSQTPIYQMHISREAEKKMSLNWSSHKQVCVLCGCK